MKPSPLTTIFTILSSLVLFSIGIYFNGQFLEWTLPDIEGLKYTVNTMSGHIGQMLAFPLVLALVPVSIFLTWKFAPVIIKKRKVLNVIIVIGSVILAAILRQQWLVLQSDLLLKAVFDKTYPVLLPAENFNVTNYMFYGLIIGTLISYFTLKESKIVR